MAVATATATATAKATATASAKDILIIRLPFIYEVVSYYFKS